MMKAGKGDEKQGEEEDAAFGERHRLIILNKF
jgi:hypothetical protein